MMTAPISEQSPPPAPDAAFLDAAGCARWLKTVPLINAAAAHRQLTTRLTALNAVEIGAETRLGILEMLRQPVVYVQTEMARGFSGKPMPLAPEARDAFRAAIALWDQLLRGYELCLQGLAGNVFASVTLALQRGMDCIARKMLDHHLAHVRVPGSAFASLHRLYRLAEKLQRASEKVPDPLSQGADLTNCTRTWVRALLLDLANPRDKRPRQVLLANRLLERWAPKVSVAAQPPDDGRQPLLYVSLDAPAGLARTPVAGSGTRVLDTGSLGKSLAKRIMGLRRGADAGSLGLPDECQQPGCEALLLALYRQWSEPDPRRAHARTETDGIAEIALGVPSTHYYLSGRPFASPDNPPTLDGEAYRLRAGIRAEQWRLKDESAGGIGLVRPAELPRESELELDQLILVRIERGALLCTVQWLLESDRGELALGTQVLGLGPQPVAVRAVDGGRWQPALFLPASLGKGPTLIVEPGAWTPGGDVEIYTHAIERWRTGATVSRGADFERVAVAPAP